MCGNVRFSARIVDHFHACHCDTCRKQTSVAFVGIDVDGDIELEDPSAVRWYRSSEWGERGFCPQCGSTLFWRAPEHGKSVVSYGAFDEAPDARFTTQLFIDKKPASYSFSQKTDDLTKAELEAMFAEEI